MHLLWFQGLHKGCDNPFPLELWAQYLLCSHVGQHTTSVGNSFIPRISQEVDQSFHSIQCAYFSVKV